MLESVDFSADELPKSAYKAQRDALLEKLVVLQQQARAAGVGLVVLFEGWDGAGKGSRISDLMYELDARATSVHVLAPFDEKAARRFPGASSGVTGFFPLMQEFWRALGERGTITFFDRGWYSAAMRQMLHDARGKAPERMARLHVESMRDFERQLVADGYVVVKFFVHMTKEGQKKRLERLHDDPLTRWRVSEYKMANVGNYDEAYRLYDRLLEGSDFDFAPWTLLNGEDKRRTNIAIAHELVSALEKALARAGAADGAAAEDGMLGEADVAVGGGAHGAAAFGVAERPCGGAAQSDEGATCAPRASRFPIVRDYPRLDAIDHTLALDRASYKAQLKKLQKRLNELENLMFQRRIPLVAMYEGWDAAGKGGNIKRVAQALDARAYTIFPSPAPTKPELMHPFLWRYWTRLPKAGHVGLYDRSWYGRVLVERVEGFATPAQWARAYDEINEFERDLVEWGAILLKFWVEVSPDEQLRRFREREADPSKQWKITDEDWRNRDKYPQYKEAVDDMFRLTSTEHAPWIVLESDDKRYARVKALRLIVEALEGRLRES